MHPYAGARHQRGDGSYALVHRFRGGLSAEIGAGAQQVACGDRELLVKAGGSDDRVAGLADSSTHQGLHSTLSCSTSATSARRGLRSARDVTGKGVCVAEKGQRRRNCLIHFRPWERPPRNQALRATRPAGWSGSTAPCGPGRRPPSTYCPIRCSVGRWSLTICRCMRRPGGHASSA